MNEPVVIKKFDQVCTLNCDHRVYCRWHKDYNKAWHAITPATAMKRVKGMMEWVCYNFRVQEKPPPEK